jgi:hypothetical protein
MRRSKQASSHKLSAESQRLATYAQAVGQAASRIEERAWEHTLDAQLQKLLKTGHQDTIDATLNALFKEDLNAYDVLMDSVEAVSESGSFNIDTADGVSKPYDVLLVAAPILAWTRFAIASGAIPSISCKPCRRIFPPTCWPMARRWPCRPTLFSIDQLPRSHVETYGKVQKLAQAAIKGTALKADTKVPETAPFLADTRYLLVAVVAPAGAPLFRWQMAEHQSQLRRRARRAGTMARASHAYRQPPAAGLRRRTAAAGSLLHGLPRSGQADSPGIDPRCRALPDAHAGMEPSDLRAVIAGFGEESADGQIDEYRVAFTQRSSPDVIYGVVWPLYGQEDEEGTPPEGQARWPRCKSR